MEKVVEPLVFGKKIRLRQAISLRKPMIGRPFPSQKPRFHARTLLDVKVSAGFAAPQPFIFATENVAASLVFLKK